MARICLTVSVVVLSAVVAYLYNLLGFGVVLDYNDEGCVLLGADLMANSEDLTHLGNGQFIVSAGDLHNLFSGHELTPGGLFLLDMQPSPPAVRQIAITGMPDSFHFQPHGIYFSNATHQVYAVTHGLAKGGGSRIVILHASENEPLTLAYRRSVVSPLFRNGVINDVIEGGSADELYVTEWLQYPLPAAGKAHPANVGEKLDLAKQSLAQIVYPGTRIFRCTYTGDDAGIADCTVAASGLYAANGITKSNDNRQVFVNDVPSKAVASYSRDETTGELRKQGTISLQYAVDNIIWAEPGVLFGGNIPIGYLMLQKGEGKDVIVPGGLVTVVLGQDGPVVDNEVLMHDGTKLNQVSVGYGWGGYALLGSPYSPGVLACPV